VGTKQEPDEQETNEHLFVVIVSPCGHFIGKRTGCTVLTGG